MQIGGLTLLIVWQCIKQSCTFQHLRGGKQLSAKEIEETRTIANVKIHVEQVIGLVRRKYVILQVILPIHFLTTKLGDSVAPIDKIVTVCCAQSNLLEYVVPFE